MTTLREFAAERELYLDGVSEYAQAVIDAYIKSLLWSEDCNGTAPLDVCDHRGKTGKDVADCDASFEYLNYDRGDLSGAAHMSISGDVIDFLISAWDDLSDDDGVWMDAGQVGHDFLLTRNHHGAGFWDRGLGERGQRLTELAHPYGNTSAYVGDDGRIYVS